MANRKTWVGSSSLISVGPNSTVFTPISTTTKVVKSIVICYKFFPIVFENNHLQGQMMPMKPMWKMLGRCQNNNKVITPEPPLPPPLSVSFMREQNNCKHGVQLIISMFVPVQEKCLVKKVKVLCWVMTTPANHKSKVIPTKIKIQIFIIPIILKTKKFSFFKSFHSGSACQGNLG